MAQSPRLATILSFGGYAAAADTDPERPTGEEVDREAASDSDDDFEFAFAQPLEAGHGHRPVEAALADDLFAHGRILPAYPVFDRRILLDSHAAGSGSGSATAPPSPDTYCAWAPRSAPGSPAQDFPKSASTGEAARRFRLRDLVGTSGAGRSHSDGKEKFVFLQPSPKTTPQPAGTTAEKKLAKKPPPQAQQQRQGGKKKAVTEMDMATAHRLFYSKAGATAGDRRQQATSYLPYRPGIVGFFATAHALGRSHHHPY